MQNSLNLFHHENMNISIWYQQRIGSLSLSQYIPKILHRGIWNRNELNTSWEFSKPGEFLADQGVCIMQNYGNIFKYINLIILGNPYLLFATISSAHSIIFIMGQAKKLRIMKNSTEFSRCRTGLESEMKYINYRFFLCFLSLF